MARLTCVALLLFACTTSTPDPTSSVEIASSDSDDYSAWFDGISDSEVEDFERQDDADHLAYPGDEISEPDHDPAPEKAARGSVAIRPLAAVGSGSASVDAGVDADAGRDAGPDAESRDAGTDALVTDAGPGDAGQDAGTDAGPACPSISVGGSLSLDIGFNVAVRDQYLGTFGPVRRHNIWARGSASGTGNLTLSGSLTATATSWTATISVSGTANATVRVHADQELVGIRRQWFALGDATLTGSVSFMDSVTFTQTCDPPGVVATTPGTPAIGVNVHLDELQFYGYFFPRLQGPVVTRVRGAIAQFARNFINRQLPGLIQPHVFAANQAYAQKKAELLAALVAKLPAGCGCPVRN